MWGDPERAIRLDASDSLSMLLFQVASPAHVPWNDPRWQELIHGYDVWVHVEVRDDSEGVLHQAVQSMSKHASNSSNLAALSRLVCQMLDELNPSTSNGTTSQADQVAAFSERIAVVGKARAAAGALQLLRIFMHNVVINYGSQPSILSEIFTYRNRDSSIDTNVGVELLHCLIHFLTAKETASLINIPEMYDAMVLSLQLLLVMLSTQLYQPMVTSLQQCQQPELKQTDFFLDIIMEEARRSQGLERYRQSKNGDSNGSFSESESNNHPSSWTPKSILSACLAWQIQRPRSPERSVARYHFTLAQSVVAAKSEKVGPDGMYESLLVVSAAAPQGTKNADYQGESGSNLSAPAGSHHQPSYILDATKGVLIQASSIIMLPFKLMSLALGLFGSGNKGGFENSRKHHFDTPAQGTSRTRDIILITESPIADLANSLLLVLANSRRVLDGAELDSSNADSRPEGNPFQVELSALTDNRWENGHDSSALPDLPGFDQPSELNGSLSLLGSINRELQEPLPGSMAVASSAHGLTINFETLFLSFGNILHTEVGALSMYTLMQSSKAFSETIASRTDLDALVMPLLRTLYLSSSARHVSALDFQSKSSPTSNGPSKNGGGKSNGLAPLSIRTCPFRSQSQLYLIVILLLLFSQDSSFGSDVFRRTIVPSVPWYKERYLKDISLGSVMLLTLLRSLTFNLNRLHDMFLLSNCCAVIMNLSHAPVVDLHEYAAMRLASVTVSCLKKYLAMTAEESKKERTATDDENGNPLLDMYGEISHALLRCIKNALSQSTIDRNLHLVYALVYHQADFKRIFAMKNGPFRKSEVNRIHSVIKTSAKIIESQQFNARTATKALQVLMDNIDQIQEAVADKKKKATDKEDFRFTYEEESDPESFFVPYIWEVIVCSVSASSIEWDRNSIQVFPLLEVEVTPDDVAETDAGASAALPAFADDILDIV